MIDGQTGHTLVTLASEEVAGVGPTRLERRTVALLDGRHKTLGVVRRPDAVAVAVLRRSAVGGLDVFLVRQPRPAVDDPALVELVAGKFDVGETDPIAVARRELAEEAGLAAARWTTLVERLLPSPGYTTEAVTLLAAWDTRPTPSRSEDAHITGTWTAVSDALAATGAEIRDMKTIIAVQLVNARERRLLADPTLT